MTETMTRDEHLAYLKEQLTLARLTPKTPRVRRTAFTGDKRLVLLAAAAFDHPVSLEKIAVLAWQENPERFGLAGYSDLYPNFNRVGICVHGYRGLRAMGLLAKTPAGYVVTQAGLEALKGYS